MKKFLFSYNLFAFIIMRVCLDHSFININTYTVDDDNDGNYASRKGNMQTKFDCLHTHFLEKKIDGIFVAKKYLEKKFLEF